MNFRTPWACRCVRSARTRNPVTERLAAFIVGEGNWLPTAMSTALIATAVLLFRVLFFGRNVSIPQRRRILAVMNLFTGVMLLVMGVGHLLAVTTKMLQGTLRGSPLVFYPIGVALVVPAWLIADNTRAILSADDVRLTVKLHAWMAATLGVLGIVNLPLAVPALCCLSYGLHKRQWLGWAIVAVMTIACTGLFVGGLIFMASGKTFEEFSATP
jgi:uncharacterized membrane protein YidH (DUF202 family)